MTLLSRIQGTTLEIADDNTISWEQLKAFFGECYDDFKKWISGQDVTTNGAFAWDVANYIKGDRCVNG